MNKIMNATTFAGLMERLEGVEEELAAIRFSLHSLTSDGPAAPDLPGGPRFTRKGDMVAWAGAIGREPEVLSDYPQHGAVAVFPEGVYRFNLEVTPPEHLIGAKKDFRVLLIDIVDQGRGLDPERQFHVECGEKQSGLFFGGHQLRGGDGWPGKGISSRIAIRGLALEGSYVVGVPMPFRLVLGEFVVPDPKARKTSPEGTRYKIEMIRE